MSFQGHRTTLFRAYKKPNGKVVVLEADSIELTTKVVAHESDYLIAKGQGWCDEPQEALDRFEAEEQALGNAAGERAASDLKMSEKAQKEAADYEKTVPLVHVPVIPEVPVRPKPLDVVKPKPAPVEKPKKAPKKKAKL